jgi:hypothetical protein
MSFLDFTKDIKTLVVQAPTTGTNSTSMASQTVDMAGFNSCAFVTTIEASSVLTTQAVWGSTSTTAGDFAILNYNSSTVVTSQTSTSSKGALITNVHRTTRRYLKLIVESTGARPHGGTVAYLYNAGVRPTTNASTDVHASTTIVSS